MKAGKHAKKKFRKFDVYSLLIIIAALFMSIGYAEVSGIEIKIDGEVVAVTQEGVFITEVIDVSKDTGILKTKNFTGTVLDSEIVLESKEDSLVTLQITLYNNSDKDYVFIGVITDESNQNLYSNLNIEFNLNKEEIEENVTTISSNNSLTFTITFGYKEGADISNGTLISKLNFRFQEEPKLLLSNEGQTFTLNNIYPDYTPQEYKFTVSNYDETKINEVPLSYGFEITIDNPLTAKIYDENGKEVTENISISGDGQTQIEHTYILKIIWDNSNQEENVDYNNLKYANNEFKCNIILKAIPNGENSEKYLDYKLTKEFNIDITTALFKFETKLDNEYVEFANNEAEINLTVKNNDGNDYNIYDTTYKIILKENNKFTLYVDGEEAVDNEIIKVLELKDGENLLSDELKIELVPKEGITLDIEEQCSITIEATNPYQKTVNYEINITRDLGINPTITEEMIPVKYQNGEWVEADVTKTGDWFDYGYQKWANVKTDNGYFVYIPRFAYKITNGYHTALSTAGTIAIVYLNEDNTPKTGKDSEGNIVSQSDLVTADQVNSSTANTGINATTKYIIHPAFTAFDTTEKNVDGLWVAKYEMSMEETTDGGNTWNHKSVQSTTAGNILTTTDTTKRMVSKPGVSSWRYIDVTNIFDNCYNMNRNLDSHMMKNTEWGAVTYLGMSKFGKGATNEIEQNKSSSYLTGYGASGTLSSGSASTTGNMYGVFDMSGGSYEYVAGYLAHTCLVENGTLYSSNKSLITADEKYKDVYQLDTNGGTSDAFNSNSLKVGDGLWEVSDGESTWFKNEFFYAGLLSGEHYPIFDRGGDYGSWSASVGINYTGRNNGVNHPGVTFRAVIYVK